MHAQIVLCPDLNDGAHLERTVVELARFAARGDDRDRPWSG